jgi:hypothetical protein
MIKIRLAAHKRTAITMSKSSFETRDRPMTVDAAPAIVEANGTSSGWFQSINID